MAKLVVVLSCDQIWQPLEPAVHLNKLEKRVCWAFCVKVTSRDAADTLGTDNHNNNNNNNNNNNELPVQRATRERIWVKLWYRPKVSGSIPTRSFHFSTCLTLPASLWQMRLLSLLTEMSATRYFWR
jgi:hypothetical protein